MAKLPGLRRVAECRFDLVALRQGTSRFDPG